MRIKIVLLTALFLAFSLVGFARSKTKPIAPNAIVRNLYAAQKANRGPFFQTKNRAIVDKYFTKKFADLIWKDAITAKGEVGAIDFDPLYGSQDPQVTEFTIMETGWGGDESKFGRDDEAVVQVTFKDSGEERMVSFEFKQGKDKTWKIYDIRYSDGNKLLEILSNAAGQSAAMSAIRKVDSRNLRGGSAQSSKQVSAQEKKELFQLILEGNEGIGETLKDNGVSLDGLADNMSVKKVDLNRDGQPEYIIELDEMHICGAHANCPDWVYRKTGSKYQLLLSTFGQELLLEKTSTNRFRDLRSTGSDSAFEGSLSIYKFDGKKYQLKACYTRKYASDGRKEKIILRRCEENN